MTELALPQDHTSTIPLPESRRRITPLALVVVVLMVMLLALAEAARERAQLAGQRAEAVRNCHEIIVHLRLYSPDMQGLYPYQLIKPRPQIVWGEAKNSNEVFRELFIHGQCREKDEVIFGCPRSPFHPDGNAGIPPTCTEALQRGENHWAMTGNLTDSSPGDFPLIFENPADANLPLRWNADASGKAKPGRCWQDRSVVVGFNDGTVRWMPLEDGSGLRKLKKMQRSGGDHGAVEDVFPPSLNEHWMSGPILQVDE